MAIEILLTLIFATLAVGTAAQVLAARRGGEADQARRARQEEERLRRISEVWEAVAAEALAYRGRGSEENQHEASGRATAVVAANAFWLGFENIEQVNRYRAAYLGEGPDAGLLPPFEGIEGIHSVRNRRASAPAPARRMDPVDHYEPPAKPWMEPSYAPSPPEPVRSAPSPARPVVALEAPEPEPEPEPPRRSSGVVLL